MKIKFITENKKKLEEAKQIFSDFPIEIIGYSLHLPELQGEPEEVAIQKCIYASDNVNISSQEFIITEDTSLCFNALNGLPGIYIKWFQEKIGNKGLNNLLNAYEDKSAYTQCIISLSSGKGSEIKTFIGRTDGKIIEERGTNNFGWDPIFVPDGSELSYAEMSNEDKNIISARYKALTKLKNYFLEKTVI